MYRQLYLIGLHGPDILLYYKPLKSNPVNRIGFGMHERPGMEFFRYAVKVIEKKKNKEPYLAYMYGVMCQFALDVSCHGYIDKKIAESGVTHAEIEVEFDRMLMDRYKDLSLAGRALNTLYSFRILSVESPERCVCSIF